MPGLIPLLVDGLLSINPSTLIPTNQLLNWYYYDGTYKDHSLNLGTDFVLTNTTLGSQNGNDIVLMNGVNAFMESSSFPEIMNKAGANINQHDPRCRIMLFRVDGAGNKGQFLNSYGRPGSNNYVAFNPTYKGFNNTFLHNVYSAGTVTVTDYLINPYVSQSKWILLIINAKYSTTPKFIERYVVNLTDQTVIYNLENQTNAINNNGNFDFVHGQQKDSSTYYGNFFSGAMAEELIFIPNLSGGETTISWDLINGLAKYLTDKWGFSYIAH